MPETQAFEVGVRICRQPHLLDRASKPAAGAMETDRRLGAAIVRAVDSLVSLQRDGHWVFELEADATMPAAFILLQHYLGTIETDLQQRLATYLRDSQGADGGWPLFHGGGLDLSASVIAYFALKAAGDAADAPHMERTRAAILARGGARRSSVFVRITLALFGEVPWRAVPVMPVEIVLLPHWFPFHLNKISYWSWIFLVPVLVLMAVQPQARNPHRITIRELFVEPPELVRDWIAPPNPSLVSRVFTSLDRLVRKIEPAKSNTRRSPGGIAYLLKSQSTAGTWNEPWFPRVFYLRYHGYRAFSPLWALARFRCLSTGNSHRISFGL